MDWYKTIFEVIDMRSFSNLWYWIALAVLWSSASHWVLGVPFDMITKARKLGGAAEADLQMMTYINAGRITNIMDVSGLWITGIVACMLTGFGLLGFYYKVELAQAVFCLTLPMALVGLFSIRTARKIEQERPVEAALHRRLIHHRVLTQGIGMLAILGTSMWGMFQNLRIGVL